MTTEPLTDAVINRRLTEALGLDLTLRSYEISDAVLNSYKEDFFSWGDEKIPTNQVFGNTHRNLMRPSDVWDLREGKPWQAALEAYIKNCKRTPPNWAGDLAACAHAGRGNAEAGLGAGVSRIPLG
jgi:hypothetical protein